MITTETIQNEVDKSAVKLKNKDIKEIKEDAELTPQQTEGRGDCAFHASFGIWSSSFKRYICPNVAMLRNQIANEIRNRTKSRANRAIMEAMQQMIIAERHGGKAFRLAKEQFQKFLDFDERQIREAWEEFEKELMTYPEIIAFINERAPLGKDLRNKVFICLQNSENELYAIMLSLEDLHKKYKTYTEKTIQGFDWEALLGDKELREEYAALMERAASEKTEGYWLLPGELEIIAIVLNITIELHITDGKTKKRRISETYNPDATQKVSIYFNGRNHYERMVTKSQLELESDKSKSSVTANAIQEESKSSQEQRALKGTERGALLYLQQSHIRGALKATVEDGLGQLAKVDASKAIVEKDVELQVKSVVHRGTTSVSKSTGSACVEESKEELELKRVQELASLNISSLSQPSIYLDASAAYIGGNISSHFHLDTHYHLPPKASRKYPLLEQLKQGKAVTWFLPNQHHVFVGREVLLAELNAKLTSVSRESKEIQEKIETHKLTIVGVCAGTSGVGKTQLALQYVHHTKHPFTLRAWFLAENLDSLRQQYIEFAKEFCGLEGTISFEKALLYVKAWLKDNPGWLLVFDNVHSYETLKPFLPESDGSVIVTSVQRSIWPHRFQILNIDVMSEEEAIRLIKALIHREISDKELSELKILVKELGFLPLALAQAGQYMFKNKKTVSEYLKLYHQFQEKLLASNLLPPGAEHVPVAITWNASLAAIENEGKGKSLARILITMMSYCSPEPIPRGFLLAWFKEAYPSQESELIFDELLGQMHSYSLIDIDSQSQTCSIHRLVQVVLRHQHCQPKQIEVYPALTPEWYHLLLKVAHLEFYHETSVVESELRRKLLHPHLQSLQVHYEHLWPRQESVILADILSDIAFVFLDYLHEASSAKPYYERALSIFERYGGKEHVEVATVLECLGIVYGTLGDFNRQLERLKCALVIKESKYGKEHTAVADTRLNLGITYGNLGDAKQKKEQLECALLIYEREYGKEHAKVAITLVNLGNAHRELGDAKQAKGLLERARVIIEREYGKKHVVLAKTLASLGYVYRDLGDVKQQKVLLELALPIFEQEYGKEHEEVSPILVELGNICVVLGDYKQSRELLERALPILELKYGQEHIEVAKILENLGIVYMNLRDAEYAKELLIRALVIKKQKYGEQHVEIAKTLMNLSNVYRILQDAEQQKKVLENALEICEIVFGKDHSEVAIPLYNLSIVYLIQGDINQSKTLFERALPILRQTYGIEHPYTIQAKKLLDRYAKQFSGIKIQQKPAQAEIKLSKETGGTAKASLINMSGATVGGSVSVSVHNQIQMNALPPKPRKYPLLEQLKLGKGVSWSRGGALPRQDIEFVGRETLLQELESKLALEHKEAKEKIEIQSTLVAIIACTGLGGIGKTQLALKYIRDTQNAYTLRAWFPAEDKVVLQQCYMKLAEALGYSEDKPSFQNAQIYLKQWLSQNPGWLLVYDNVTDYKSIQDFLPDQGGRVLLTTRQRDWPSSFRILEIKVMTEEESLRLIASLIGRKIEEKEIAEAKVLVKTLGYLPLALAQAGAYLKVNGINIPKYLELYKKHEAMLLAEKGPEGTSGLPVAVTWDINLEAIIQEAKAQNQPVFALNLLIVCAYLAPEKISYDLLLTWFKIAYPKLDSELILPKVIGQLWRYSLVNRDGDGNVTVHRLVQSILRYKHKQAFEKLSTIYPPLNIKWYEILLKVAYQEFTRETQALEDEAREKLLLPHLKALTEHFERLWPNEEPEIYGDILEAIGFVLLYRLHEPRSAILYYERALAIFARKYDKEHLEIVRVSMNLGNAYGELGDTEKGITLLERALDIQERRYGKGHLEIVKPLVNLGTAYGDLRNASKAIECFQRALVIQEREYGKEHLEVARTLGNLGAAYDDLKDYKQQILLLERALAIKEREYGKEHLAMAIPLYTLSIAYKNLGEFRRATELLEQRVLPIYKRDYGEQHLKTTQAKSILDECIEQLAKSRVQQKCSQAEIKLSKETEGSKKVLLLSSNLPKGLERRNITELPELIKVLEQCKIGKDGKDLPPPELALRRAAAAGKIEIIKTLLKLVKDIDINQPGPSGKTAIVFAKEYNKMEVVEFLISVGAKYKVEETTEKKKLSTSI